MALQLLLSVWRTATSLVCMIPGLVCTILGSQSGAPDFLVLLALPLTLLGSLAGYFCYVRLLPAQYLLARSPELGVGQALRQGLRLLKGSGRDFFLLQLSFLVWHLVSLMLYQVLDLYVVPYQHMASMLFLTALDTVRETPGGPDLTLL